MNGNARAVESLESIRKSRGIDGCKAYFSELLKSNRGQALALLNDPGLSFGSLFLLGYEIQAFGLQNELSPRNFAALAVCSKVLGDKKQESEKTSFAGEDAKSTLLWMFRTGAADDGMSNDFDQVLDIVASILVKSYGETSILPLAAETLFQRNRKGTYRHDLAWALFRSHDPSALRLVAERLRSENEQDAAFARTLLNLPEAGNSGKERQTQYSSYLAWLKENEPYLYFTNESFNGSNEPSPCDVDLEAKYLHKSISHHSRAPLAPWTEEEQTCRGCFRGAEEEEKRLLAAYSHRMRMRNPAAWRRWIRLPLAEQLRIAAGDRRGTP